MGDPVKGMCAVGAISFASLGNTQLSTKPGACVVDASLINQRNAEAIAASHDFGAWLYEAGYSEHCDVTIWNDDIAKDKEEVITVMTKFADEVDPLRL